jgi:hypothetical protein
MEYRNTPEFWAWLNGGIEVYPQLSIRVCTKEQDQFGNEKGKTFYYDLDYDEFRESLHLSKKGDEFLSRATEFLNAFQNTQSGWVYIIGVQNTPGYYKIGYTRNCPYERMEQLNKDVIIPLELELKAAFYIKDAFKIEKHCHKLMKANRVKGEWFRVDFLDVVDCLDGLTQDRTRELFEV